MRPPALPPRTGWKPIDPFWQLSEVRGFISSDGSDHRLKLRYFRRTADRTLVARVWFGPASEGPPGHAHGGSVAAVLDEALGAAAWAAGLVVMTAKLSVRYRRMVPLGTVATIETRIRRAGRSHVLVEGLLVDRRGKAFAEAEGVFIKVPEASWDIILGRARTRGGPAASAGAKAT